MVAVATSLNARARAGGGEAAARRLGYLVGAARRGAENTDGIHANLVARLESAAEFSPGGVGPPQVIEDAYRAGIAAGRRARLARAARITSSCGKQPDGRRELTEQLWGGETTKAVENFPVSGERIPPAVVHWLGRLKAAAARVNGELGELEPGLAERIAAAGEQIAAGEHDDQFPIDVFQTGSGTSSNMNANEVIANAGRRGGPPERRGQHGPVIQRRLPLRCPPRRPRRGEAGPAAGDGRARLPRSRRSRASSPTWSRRPHPSDGRRPGHSRAGVRRLRRTGPARRAANRGDAPPRRPDPPRRDGDRHRAQHPPGVRRRGAAQARRGDRPGDLRAPRPLRGAGQPRRPGRALRGARRSTRSRSTRSPTTWR